MTWMNTNSFFFSTLTFLKSPWNLNSQLLWNIPVSRNYILFEIKSQPIFKKPFYLDIHHNRKETAITFFISCWLLYEKCLAFRREVSSFCAQHWIIRNNESYRKHPMTLQKFTNLSFTFPVSISACAVFSSNPAALMTHNHACVEIDEVYSKSWSFKLNVATHR